MSRLRTSANAALAAFSVPRIFSNTHRGWKVSMKTLAVISILALLTISGAAYTDQLFTGDKYATQGAN